MKYMKKQGKKIILMCFGIMCLLLMSKNVLAASQSNNWVWPMYVHTFKNDWPNYASGSYHGGTDFPVPLNTDVYSSCDGDVVSVQYLTTSYGRHIKIKAKVNGQIVYIRYCHLNQILVSEGQHVTAGQIIGKSGSTGNSTGPHLHYEVRNSADSYKNALNPKLYLPGTTYTYESQNNIQQGHNPQGMVDSAGGGFSKVGAAGWAFDADNCGTALEIHIYMDGKLLGTTVANLYRPDVNNVYKCGDYHGYAFETEVDASMSGEHTLDVYAINVGGGAPSVLLASKKVTISQDKEAPVISDIQVMDITANSYVVSCRVTDNTEVNRVQFPTWSAVNGQDDIVPNWPVNAAASGTRNGDIYTYTVNIADHNNDRGIYATHIYAYDKYGNCSSARVDTIEILELPEIEYDLGDDFFAIVENAYVHTALKKIHNGQTQDAIFSDKDGTREQMWHFVRNSRNEPYTIYCEGNEALVLDVSGGIDADKRNVTTWVENGSDAQKWYIRKKDGLYYLQPCCSSTRVLDVPGGQSGERNAQIYSYNTDHGTGMNIIKVDPVKVELSEEKLLTTGNYNGHRYEVFDQGMNWTDAKRSCILRGGHLVTITDAGEQEFIEKLLTNGTMNQYWLGFKKYGRNFAWITGENSEYEHWDAGEPTNGGADISYPGREYCAHIYNKTNPANGGKRFYWNDINNSNTLVNELDFFNTDVVGVICEYDYIENYTLTYDANEGVNPPKSESYEQGSTAKVTNVEPTRRGYEFVGWALKESAENAEYHAGDEIKITKNITLYAVWKAETNHNWDAGTVISEATCAKTGTIVYHCSICEETRTETIPKKEHTIVKDNAVEATCEIEGKTEGSHCSVCNTVIKKQEFVPKKEHSWNSGEIIREATCTKDGIKKITCTVCKETKIEIITQKVHTIVRDEAIPATCKETGKTAGSHCSVCNTVIQAQETIPKTEHSWDAGTIVEEASCTEEGIEKITCTVCGESKTEKVAPAGHIVVKDEAIEATCTTNGKTEGSHCSVCNEVIQAQEVIPKTDHRWDDGEIVTEATCTEAGIKKISCTVCGESYTEEIPAAGHTYGEYQIVKEATETEEGILVRNCSVCGKAEFVTIPKVTNPDKDPDQKPDNQETEQKPEDKGNTDKDQQQKETPDTKPNQNQQTAKKTTKKIKLNRKKLTLKKGKTFKLKVTLTPADSQDKIVYKTSNRKIATVSKTGKIKAKKKGKVKITVISGKKKAVCTVKVK